MMPDGGVLVWGAEDSFPGQPGALPARMRVGRPVLDASGNSAATGYRMRGSCLR